MSSLKFGVVGCGGQGGGWAQDLAEWEGVDLVALCDINKGTVNNMAKKLNVAYTTTDYTEIVEQDLDAIVIGTPHYLHAPITVLAAENDINVFSEKPMAINLQQCNEMIMACKQNDVKLQIGFQNRLSKGNRQIKAAMDAGLIGDLIHANVHGRWFRQDMYYVMSTPVRKEDGGKHWRGKWATEGGSALINQTIHPLDLFLWFTGPVKDIQAAAHIALHEFIETEDNVGAVLNFQNGAIGLIQAGVVYPNCHDAIALYGTKGKIVSDENGIQFDIQGKYDKSILDVPDLPGKRPIMQDFIDAINEDRPTLVPGEEGKKSIELIRGIYMSLMNNGKVSFPVMDNGTFPALGRYYKPTW